jgi:SAM-dependent methyltransferase
MRDASPPPHAEALPPCPGESHPGATELVPECPACGSGDARFLRQAPFDAGDFRRNIVRPVVRLRGAGGRWLDVGCSIGSLLAVAEAAGFEPHGLELNRSLVDWVRANRPSISVTQGKFDALDPGARFDVVSADNVFEHIHDPAAFLGEARRHLAPGGLLVVRVPNFDTLARRWLEARGRLATSYLVDPDAHPFNYTAESLRAVLGRHGFTVLATNERWVFAYPLRHVLGGRGLGAKWWARAAFGLACLGDGILPRGGVDVTVFAAATPAEARRG